VQKQKQNKSRRAGISNPDKEFNQNQVVSSDLGIFVGRDRCIEDKGHIKYLRTHGQEVTNKQRQSKGAKTEAKDLI
jgi:hypothetical protein